VILSIFKIRGTSLAPEFRDGDFVLASRLPIWFRRLRIGDVVVFRQPGYGTLIKRVAELTPCGHLMVQGDDVESVDSRAFGPVRPSDVRGRVVWHIKGRK
jgi:signal peptidase I